MCLFVLVELRARRNVAPGAAARRAGFRIVGAVNHPPPFFRNGVEPKSPGKRLAAQQALEPKPRTTNYAEALDGLICELRARRLEPAAAGHQQREIGFIESQCEERSAHGSRLLARVCADEVRGTRGRCGRRFHELHSLMRAHARNVKSLRRRHSQDGGFTEPSSSRRRSAARIEDSARATEFFGCITMSQPAGISRRCSRTSSRMRLRMRLRTTAFPRAFLMLKPKRVCGKSFARKKTVKWELERRLPAR
jgi:hypothetical protein